MRVPGVARAGAAFAALTATPVFAYLGSVAAERRPPHAEPIVGRWRAVAAVGDDSRAAGWRLRFNSFNMASVEAPDGRAVRGRVIYDRAAPGAAAPGAAAPAVPAGFAIEPIWGAPGRAVGLGFSTVRVEMAQWPAGRAPGASVEAAAADVLVVRRIATAREAAPAPEAAAAGAGAAAPAPGSAAPSAAKAGENDLVLVGLGLAFVRE
jgi:hypothetical protein